MAQPIILVTGSTSGIGKATVHALAQQGAELLLHARTVKKAQNALDEFRNTCGGEQPDILVADFAKQEEIRLMAADILSRYSRLDVLVNNAGTYAKTRQVTRDGVEVTFAVNYLAPFLLTRLLLPLLKKSTSSRIVMVASSAHEDVEHIDWENLPGMHHYEAWDAYALSKFAVITFTYTLTRSIKNSGITANCLHPGVTDTKLLMSAFPGMHGITPEEGAQTSVYLALSSKIKGVSGKYFKNMRAIRSSALTYNHGIQDRLWKIGEELTQKKEAE